jgi:LPS-assembly lipoprotein
MARRRRLLLRGLHLALLAGTGALAGCGFTLRQPPALSFRSIALQGFAPRSPLKTELERRLAAQPSLVLAPDPARAEVVLHVLEDRRERSVVASTAAAQVRELQLRIQFHFRVDTPSGRELLPRAELLLKRDMSTSETAALAKAQEEEELYREMQSDIVGQVLRRLASVRA